MHEQHERKWDRRTQVTVAVIGAVGTLGAALIGVALIRRDPSGSTPPSASTAAAPSPEPSSRNAATSPAPLTTAAPALDTGAIAILRTIYNTPPLRKSAVFRARFAGAEVTWTGTLNGLHDEGGVIRAAFSIPREAGGGMYGLERYVVHFRRDQRQRLLDVREGDTLTVRARIDSLSERWPNPLMLGNGVIVRP